MGVERLTGDMAFDEALAGRIRQALRRKKGITEKKMFGGAGFLLNGNMLVGVWKESMIVRLDLEDYDAAMSQPHVRAFDITGRPMKGWAMVTAGGVEELDQVKDWVARAWSFVKALPAR